MPEDEAVELTRQICAGLAAVHARGILHRDLKPANVLLTSDETPRITDFGLAKKLDEQGQTVSGAIMGTPSYMSPEQASGSKDVGTPADTYALGAILYECLTGRPPFIGDSPVAVAYQHVREPASPPSDLDDQLGVAVAKGDEAMLGAVDATLDRIEEDGTLERIVETWIPVPEN